MGQRKRNSQPGLFLIVFLVVCSCLLTAFAPLPFTEVLSKLSEGDLSCIQVNATSVYAYYPGTKNNGVPIEPSHNNPENALGAPREFGIPNYVSLGFHDPGDAAGTIILGIDPLPEGYGVVQLEVVENPSGTGNCTDRPEIMTVDVSADLGSWQSLGIGCQTATFSLDTPLAFRYVRIQDISDRTLFPEGEDGYDLDGIIAIACPIHPTPTFTVTPTFTPIDTLTPVPPSPTATLTLEPSPSTTITPTKTSSPTLPLPIITATPTPSSSVTLTPTYSPTPSSTTETLVPSLTSTPTTTAHTPTSSLTSTSTITPSITSTPVVTTPTLVTLTPSITHTPSPTSEPTATYTPTPTYTLTPTFIEKAVIYYERLISYGENIQTNIDFVRTTLSVLLAYTIGFLFLNRLVHEKSSNKILEDIRDAYNKTKENNQIIRLLLPLLTEFKDSIHTLGKAIAKLGEAIAKIKERINKFLSSIPISIRDTIERLRDQRDVNKKKQK